MKTPVLNTLACAGALGLTTIAVGAPAASAHDAVVGGNPADGATVSEFPARVELDFSGDPQSGFSTMAVSKVGDTGEADVLYSGEPEVEGRAVTLDLPGDLDPQPGEYRVGFQIVSSDGHATKGMTTFTYEPAGGSSSAAAAPSEQSGALDTGSTDTGSDNAGSDEESDGSSRAWTIIGSIVGLLVIAGAGVAALVKLLRVREVERRETLSSGRTDEESSATGDNTGKHNADERKGMQ